MISTEDYLYFVDQALDGMLEIITRLGDDLANRRPDLPGANSPYAILTHCLGVMDYWAGHVLAGRDVQRDRDAEFRAAGTVADLLDRAHQARRQLEADIAHLDPSAPPRRIPPGKPNPAKTSQGGALIHIYEELAQHRGQLESCRDLLLTDWAPLG
jgi:uncharacterized damage-inducible protein DinB